MSGFGLMFDSVVVVSVMVVSMVIMLRLWCGMLFIWLFCVSYVGNVLLWLSVVLSLVVFVKYVFIVLSVSSNVVVVVNICVWLLMLFVISLVSGVFDVFVEGLSIVMFVVVIDRYRNLMIMIVMLVECGMLCVGWWNLVVRCVIVF